MLNLIFKVLNPIMKAWLHSPFHGLISKQIMSITFTGRSSGKVYSTPVSYYQEDGKVYCFTHGAWWKNMRGGAGVRLRIRGENLEGHAVAIQDVEVIAAGLDKFFTHVPGDAVFYGLKIDPETGIKEEDLVKAAQSATMIEIQLQ